MRIALLTDGIPPYRVGGIQSHSRHLAEGLARLGADVDLYACGDAAAGAEGVAAALSADVRARVRPVLVPWPAAPRLPAHFLWQSWRHSVAVHAALAARIARTDFVYAQGFPGWKALVERAAGRVPVPVGVNFHGLEPFQRPASFGEALRRHYFRAPIRRCCRRADVVFSLGARLTGLLVGFGVPRERVVEIPNAVGSEWLAEAPRRRRGPTRFVFVGRLERRKGVEELTRALRGLLPVRELAFDFVGPVPERLRLRDARVRYHGLLTGAAAVRAVVREADVLVCPSWSEGMPTVVLEAMASGLAIVATDVGAMAELVGEDDGWLVPPADEAALRAALVAAIESDEAALSARKSASLARVRAGLLWPDVARATLAVAERAKEGSDPFSRSPGALRRGPRMG
jgi:glycosyltransferase involved in cell wall biosynthesis